MRVRSGSFDDNEVPESAMIPLVCPHCGATLVITMETAGRPFLQYETPAGIECYATDCEAEWEPNGEARRDPRWLRYPDLYTEPQRAAERRQRREGA